MIVRSILLVLALILPAYAREMISGNAHVIDGDTLEIGGTKIRLQGIDAPEADQIGLDGWATRRPSENIRHATSAMKVTPRRRRAASGAAHS
jgi:endonuclease YncB( thermonuclease family)